MEPVTVNFKLSEGEWVGACRWLLRRNKALRVLALLAAVVWVLILSLLTLLPSVGFDLLKLLVPAALVSAYLPYHMLSALPRRYYRGDRKFRDGVSMAFTDEFIHARGKLIESRVSWELYTDVHDVGEMYVLVYGQDINTVTPIPKRAFRSERDEQDFRAIAFPRFGRKLGAGRPASPAVSADDYRPASLQPPDWR